MRMLVAVLFVAALAACSEEEPVGPPSSAQEEALLGTWEATFFEDSIEVTSRLTFQADGIFELVFEVPGLSVSTTGTYQVAGDSLWSDAVKIVMVDGDGDKLEINDEKELADAGPSGTFAIEGDTLFITTTVITYTEENEDGEESLETLEFHRK